MDNITINIGDKEYKVSIGESDEEQEVGLSNIDSLAKNEGMLFVFDSAQEVSMWMKDTLIPLDIIFINEDLEVISIIENATPNEEKIYSENNVQYVLEVNANSGIKIGDELEFNKNSLGEMHMLREDGTSQMQLFGGERIFSIANSKILIKFAKKAETTKKDSDYKALGKRVFKFLDIQESNDDEFVEL